MLVVKHIRIWTLDRDSLTISWEFRDTADDLAEYTVTILRSGSEVGEYEEVSDAITADLINEFVDSEVNLHSKHREWYYRIRVTDPEGDYLDYGSEDPDQVIEGGWPGAAVMAAYPDLEALEAIRRFDIVARGYAGLRVLALTQRTTGQRCAECWDHLKRRRKKASCTTCYGAGISGGYYYPRECHAIKVPDQVVNQLSPLFELQVQDMLVWLTSRPRLKPRDLLIGIHGKRWRVVKVQRSEKLWALTRQTVQLREISRDQVEYDISIDPEDWGVDSFTVSPHRQFIRAMDIDSYRRKARDLGVTESTDLA